MTDATAAVRLTLAERARAAYEQDEAERQKQCEETRDAEIRGMVTRFLDKLSTHLDVQIGPDDVRVEPNPDADEEEDPYLAYADIDGLTFTMNPSRWGYSLEVMLPCDTEGCDGSARFCAEGLALLGDALRHNERRECRRCWLESLESHRATKEPADPPVPPKRPTPDDYIDGYYSAGEEHAQATARVHELADRRGIEKSAAILRLIGTPNPETDRPHSASSAKDVVESDEQYAAFRQAEREAEVERIRSETHWKACYLKALLEVGRATQRGIE